MFRNRFNQKTDTEHCISKQGYQELKGNRGWDGSEDSQNIQIARNIAWSDESPGCVMSLLILLRRMDSD